MISDFLLVIIKNKAKKKVTTRIHPDGSTFIKKHPAKTLKTKLMATTKNSRIFISFNIISEPLFIFSYGWAQDAKNWFKDKSHIPEPYLQLSLVNPF